MKGPCFLFIVLQYYIPCVCVCVSVLSYVPGTWTWYLVVNGPVQKYIEVPKAAAIIF